MLKARHILPALLVVTLAGFALGVIYLFQIRFNAGDIYPPYSSLRTDPLGTKAFCESLDGLPSLAVRRFYESNDKLLGNRQRVLFLFGLSMDDLSMMSEDDYATVQTFLFSGGRVVMTLLPTATMERPDFQAAAKQSRAESRKHHANPKSRDATNSVEPSEDWVSLFDKTGLRVAYDDLSLDDHGVSRPELVQLADVPDDLPATISWHSAAFMEGMDTNWRTLYRRRKHAVMIERSFGAGTLVLATDSFFVSNEALRNERHADLLAWLIGGHREIIFDETHLGVEERPGIAGLMRRYHLEGVLLTLVFVAGLFVWKNSLPLVPPVPDDVNEGPAAQVLGQEATAGLASLLRRGLAPADLLLTCFDEWKAACARNPRAAARLAEIESIVAAEKARPAGSRQPVETYQAIQRILMQRNL